MSSRRTSSGKWSEVKEIPRRNVIAASSEPENAMPAAASPDCSVAGSSRSNRATSKAGPSASTTRPVTAWSAGARESLSSSGVAAGTR
ncbi:hypothetical protein [Streptomyces sp. C1-2]|uniref:hypothetical protein n=1 Tax=Streptomyces sp. C1-2 TaxID=2720022 RepID=UPI001F0EECF9|nr:hypothetical protein [Streptomyces sp. C1-2]